MRDLGIDKEIRYTEMRKMKMIYVKCGYILNGSGVWYQNKALDQYASCVNGDDLPLFLSKSLR